MICATRGATLVSVGGGVKGELTKLSGGVMVFRIRFFDMIGGWGRVRSCWTASERVGGVESDEVVPRSPHSRVVGK